MNQCAQVSFCAYSVRPSIDNCVKIIASELLGQIKWSFSGIIFGWSSTRMLVSFLYCTFVFILPNQSFLLEIFGGKIN